MASKISNYSILKRACKIIRWIGVGDFWYEDPIDHTFLYRCFMAIVFIHFYSVLIVEWLEVIMNSYPPDLHNDAKTMAVAHSIVVIRLHMWHYKKDKVRALQKYIVEDCAGYEEDEVLIKQYKKVKLSAILQIATVYTTVSWYLVEGIKRMYYDENMPLIIMVSYWPKIDDHSTVAMIGRIAIYVIFYYIMTCMITTDTLAVSHLIILSHKFINLRRFIRTLEDDFRSKDVTALVLKKKCLDGVLLHEKLIRMAAMIHDTFGLMMSLHVCQGSALIVLALLRVAVSPDVATTVLLMIINFVLGLLIQLALYLWNAGEITYQASRMSVAIFHCGWQWRGVTDADERDLRRIVLMGCAQAQRPLVMKAFGLQDLSYQTFVSILRVTYSVFAVLYNH